MLSPSTTSPTIKIVPMNPVNAVLFDFGQVLSLPPDPAVWQQLRSISGLSEANLYNGYWRYRHDYDRDTLSGENYWRQIAADNGVSFSLEQIAALKDADVTLWSRLNMPMVEWAQRLQRAGMRTGILSNIGDAMTEGLIARFDWLAGFDHCTWSYALKLAKPEAAIYRCAAEGLATPPENILFIDDKQENVEAALATGMQAIQYINHDSFEREMRQRGLASLLDLPAAAAK